MSSSEGVVEVQEHFENAATQAHAVRLGVWVFLGSETLLFAGLFALYAGVRTQHTSTFLAAAAHNNAVLGTAMTVILLISSFSVAWALHSLRHGRRRTALISLLVTLALGAAFGGLKLYEYSHHFAEGIYPGQHYSFAEMPSTGAQLFFTLYFLMTGLHAAHVAAGLMILTWVGVLIYRRRVDRDRYIALEMGALYWHLVDAVWIFLWPLLYLSG